MVGPSSPLLMDHSFIHSFIHAHSSSASASASSVSPCHYTMIIHSLPLAIAIECASSTSFFHHAMPIFQIMPIQNAYFNDYKSCMECKIFEA